jgi:hypothetical protein
MNTIITLEDPGRADFDPKLHRNMNDALALLHKQLELFEPEALRLFELFVPWIYSRPLTPGQPVDAVWLRRRFRMFPFLRLDELLGHAQRDLDRVEAPPSERMAGLREVKADLKELLVAFWHRDASKLFRPLLRIVGLAVIAVGVCAGALSLLP